MSRESRERRRKAGLAGGSVGIEQPPEVVRVNRLDKICVESGASGTPTVLGVATRRHGHQQGAGECGMATQALGDLAAVYNAWHDEIAKHRIGPKIVGRDEA